MKKILKTLLTIMLSIPYFLYSQTVAPPNYASIDTNYRTYVNNLFGLLEPNRVSTGLLLDYGFDFTDPKIYNGSVLVDSTKPAFVTHECIGGILL